MSSNISGYASYLTQLSSLALINEHSFDLAKKFLDYSILSAAVAGSAFYFGYNYAKNRHRFDPRSREDSRNEQV